MKATYDDTILMDGLLLSARAVLAEAEEIQAGRKARLTLHGEADTLSFVLPWRVVAYARQAMGQPAAVREAGRVVFTVCGVTRAFLPSAAGWERLVRAVAAHLYAEQRAAQRQLAIYKADFARNEATLNRLRGGEGKEGQS